MCLKNVSCASASSSVTTKVLCTPGGVKWNLMGRMLNVLMLFKPVDWKILRLIAEFKCD